MSEKRNDYRALMDMVLRQVRGHSHLMPVDDLAREERPIAKEVLQLLAPPHGAALAGWRLDPERTAEARNRIAALRQDGRISESLAERLLCAIAGHPEVSDYDAVEAHAAKVELLAADARGDERSRRLAAAQRHRGIAACRTDRLDEGLELFQKAFALWPSAQNMSNILGALLMNDQLDEARALLRQLEGEHPEEAARLHEEHIAVDPDLIQLRKADSQ